MTNPTDGYQRCPVTTGRLMAAAAAIASWQIRLEDDPRGLAAVNDVAEALGFCKHTPRRKV